MSLRKVFAGATLLSVTGAILLGGVFAWRTDQKVSGEATVGYQAFQIVDFIDGKAELLGPNGAESHVAWARAQNTGHFLIEITGGDVTIDDVTNWGIGGEPGPNNPACTTEHFSGAVRLDEDMSQGWDYVLSPGEIGGEFDIFLKVEWEAPNSCMGAVIQYTVTVYGENPLSEAPGGAG